MKLDELLEEMPQSILPMESYVLNKKASNIVLARNILKKNYGGKVLRDFGDNTYLYEFPSLYIMFDMTDKTSPIILYYLKYIIKNIPSLRIKVATQVMVWRKPVEKTIGLPRYIFWNYILPKTGYIMTDAQQTPDGRRFWEQRISNAIADGKNVYFVELMSPRNIIQIHSIYDLEELEDKTYGGHSKFQSKRIVITDRIMKPTDII